MPDFLDSSREALSPLRSEGGCDGRDIGGAEKGKGGGTEGGV